MRRQNVAAVLLDIVRTQLHRVITTPFGDRFAPVRVPKDLARRLNVTFGQPLCSSAELTARRAAVAKLSDLRRGRQGQARATGPARVAAPVVVYFEKDRNARELAHVEELLSAKSIAFSRLDVAGDEATLTFVTRTAGCESDVLPVVFVGDAPIGGYRALVEADVSGTLEKALFG
jgi:glutaredoxin